MNSFEVYQLYISLKNHFTQKSYDFFKYNGKTSAKVSSFETRKDKVFFQKLAKHNDPKNFLLANLLEDPKAWIRDIAYSDKAEDTYKQWIKKAQSLTYVFKSDLSKLNEDFNSNFTVEEYDHPHLLKLYLRKEIELETLIMIADITGCIKSWDKKMVDDPIWDRVKMKITKYKPFINYDHEKIKEIIVYKFS